MRQHAFQANRLSGYAGLFPLGFDLRAVEHGVWRGYLHAQSVAEAAEILPGNTKGRVCVFGVDHNWYDRDGGEPISLEEIARRQGLTPDVLDKDIILIGITELPTLLVNFSHYNMSLLDVGADIDQDTALDSVLKATDVQWGKEESILESLAHADVYLSSHDDCFLYVESRRYTHLVDHLRCLLKHYVSARLKETISLPPSEIVDDYLSCHASLTILDDRTDLVGGVLRVPCSSERFSFREKKTYPLAALMLVDVEAGQWRLERAG